MELIESAQVLAPPELLINVLVLELAALKVIAPAVAFPIWLLLILTVVVTVPELEMPVNPPVVAVVVFPLMMLLLIFSVLIDPVFIIHPIVPDEEAPDIAQFKIKLLVMFSVIVFTPLTVLITVKVPEVLALVIVTVLFEIVLVNVPVGAPPV